MKIAFMLAIGISALDIQDAWTSEAIRSSAGKRLNNLTTVLLETSNVSKSATTLVFTRPDDGWIFISATCKGKGTLSIKLDQQSMALAPAEKNTPIEAFSFVHKGEHQINLSCGGNLSVHRFVVKAIPELIHCGLGYDPQIKSYGHYDMAFLGKDVLPNVTSLIVPNNLQLSPSIIDDWHKQGKRFIAEVGVNSQAKTAEEHFQYWTSFFQKAPFMDGIIINEFIVNNPSTTNPAVALSPERQKRIEKEQQLHQVYGEAIRQVRADDRYRQKQLYAYIGGSGKKLNQEMIGTNFIPTIVGCDYRVALERYLHEMSSQAGSSDALRVFVEGIADWEAKVPGVKKHMVIAFGLFSMPPGGINKLPNVDYHVWMDQQMNAVANNPLLTDMAGLEWWTSTLADEETVRFVGKLYRHYALEGHTNLLTKDPLFLTHIQNGDFAQGTNGWTLHPAESDSIATGHFPRYGRIEGRFMGLGRPADPEHIGDTFLRMRRTSNGTNSFSQTIKHLQPGRLYSMKMFSCDYNDLLNPTAKKMEEATPFIGKVTLEGVEIDAKRSFTEMYASTPEPKIPVWITYHWKIFRAKRSTAKLTVSDWDPEKEHAFGQDQIFNFVEIQPYHE